MTTGYPAILLLDGRLGVVVGGGAIAERKIRSLLDAGARVRAIAPHVTATIEELATAGEIDLNVRSYRSGDLSGASIVIAATDDEGVNEQVSTEARASGILVNVVDDVERCTFIAPSIIRRGDLLIAISTGGTHPALAVRIRERLEREFDGAYHTYLDLISRLRREHELAATQIERAAAWYRVADSDVFDLVRAGRADEAYERAVELLGATT